MITILAEADHQNINIAKKQLEIINYNISISDEPILVIMEMSPLLLWIMQNKIFEGVKNVSKLSICINIVWNNMRKELTKLAIQGKIYLMSYDVVQIMDYQNSIEAKKYFNVDLPNAWECPNIYGNDLSKFRNNDKKLIDRAIKVLQNIKLVNYDNPFTKIHNYIFNKILEYMHISYDTISNHCNLDNVYTSYMIARDTIGTDYINKFLTKFNNYNITVICHVVHAYYSHPSQDDCPDSRLSKKYIHKFPENTDRRLSDYSNKLEPFAGNIVGNKKNILIFDGKRKYHKNSLEYKLIKLNKYHKKIDELDQNKDYMLQSSYVMLFPSQFDYFLVA
jgi:hypothetical protein